MAVEPLFTSPKRINGYYVDSSSSPDSPLPCNSPVYPWNWCSRPEKSAVSPDVSMSLSFSSPETPSPCRENKRGRPRADSITSLIQEGSQVESHLRCRVCSRVFPREKSLQAHMRTHTGERPYTCDFPGCGKAFCQSGQLKTHQRLHTGEKPFICTSPGCRIRFTHANRHCPEHPFSALERAPLSDSPEPGVLAEASPQVQKWLNRYYEYRTPLKQKVSTGASSTKRSLHQDIENEYAIETKRRAAEVNAAHIDQPPMLPLGECNSPIKRAPPNTPEKAYPCHRQLPFNSPESVMSRDKMLGALALIELSGNPVQNDYTHLL